MLLLVLPARGGIIGIFEWQLVESKVELTVARKISTTSVLRDLGKPAEQCPATQENSDTVFQVAAHHHRFSMARLPCPYRQRGCGHSYKNQGALTNHVRTIHTNPNIIFQRAQTPVHQGIVDRDADSLPDASPLSPVAHQQLGEQPVPPVTPQTHPALCFGTHVKYHPHLTGEAYVLHFLLQMKT